MHPRSAKCRSLKNCLKALRIDFSKSEVSVKIFIFSFPRKRLARPSRIDLKVDFWLSVAITKSLGIEAECKILIKNTKAIFQEIESAISQDKVESGRLEHLNCDVIKEKLCDSHLCWILEEIVSERIWILLCLQKKLRNKMNCKSPK